MGNFPSSSPSSSSSLEEAKLASILIGVFGASAEELKNNGFAPYIKQISDRAIYVADHTREIAMSLAEGATYLARQEYGKEVNDAVAHLIEFLEHSHCGCHNSLKDIVKKTMDGQVLLDDPDGRIQDLFWEEIRRYSRTTGINSLELLYCINESIGDSSDEDDRYIGPDSH